jgi:hypothetical protein
MRRPVLSEIVAVASAIVGVVAAGAAFAFATRIGSDALRAALLAARPLRRRAHALAMAIAGACALDVASLLVLCCHLVPLARDVDAHYRAGHAVSREHVPLGAPVAKRPARGCDAACATCAPVFVALGQLALAYAIGLGGELRTCAGDIVAGAPTALASSTSIATTETAAIAVALEEGVSRAVGRLREDVHHLVVCLVVALIAQLVVVLIAHSWSALRTRRMRQMIESTGGVPSARTAGDTLSFPAAVRPFALGDGRT